MCMNRDHFQCTKHPNFIRGLEKSRAMSNERKQQRILNYNKNPHRCLLCSSIIPYNKKINKFCSRTCFARYNNKNRSKEIYKKQSTTLKNTLKSKNEDKPIYTKVYKCINCDKWAKRIKNRKTCSNECYLEILSKIATNNPQFGGNKNNKAYGWYESKFAGKVWLESSYEYKVALSLDKNSIEWIRPNFLIYNNSKKYYPDFYLPKYNIYLDPKNDFLIEQDKIKIQQVMDKNNVEILILNKDQLSWNIIKQLL